MTKRRRPTQGNFFANRHAGKQILAAAAPLGDPTTLQGVLHRFVWRDAEKRFGIAVLRTDDGVHWTVKGNLAGLCEGESLQIWGKTEQDSTYGPQFRLTQAQPLLPATEQAVLAYLKSERFPGIGAALAERILAALGPTALTQIQADPEILTDIKGLTAKKREALLQALAEHTAEQAHDLFFRDLGLGPHLITRIAQRYGRDAVRLIRENPYRLAQQVAGIGFRTADRIALSLGFALDAQPRIAAGVHFALQDLATQGHTAPPVTVVTAHAVALLAVSEASLEPIIQQLCEVGSLRRIDGQSGTLLALPGLADDEALLAERLHALLQRPAQSQDLDVQVRLALAENALGFALQGTQREAVAMALSSGLCVVTGGPGTGKTTIIRGVLAALQPDSARILLAAPTGRAARRLAESTGQEAKTLHRLLEFEPRLGRFQRHEGHPLEADLVIVDEVSMAEVPLMSALCAALPEGARLMLVGDADQLPSVGPGAVLHDVIASGRAAVMALDRIFRQGEGSLIVGNAHRVRQGQLPETSNKPGEDFYLLPRQEVTDIVATLIEVVARRLPRSHGFDPIADVQVLVPMHKGPLGTQALNELLRQALNPVGAVVGGGFRAGDKVLQTRNDYELEVFNGDIGRVMPHDEAAPTLNRQAILGSEPTVRVRFGERDVDYPLAQIDHLQLAYAVTVHKAQGSEYPAVVMPVHMQQWVMLQRNLLYTAITRGRRFVVLVGQPGAVERAVTNEDQLRRWTLLADRLKSM